MKGRSTEFQQIKLDYCDFYAFQDINVFTVHLQYDISVLYKA